MDQELVVIVVHDELIFLWMCVGFEKEFVVLQIVDQVANEFILPEIDEVQETQGIPMNETPYRIAQSIQNPQTDLSGSNSGQRNHPRDTIVRIRTHGKWTI